MRVDLHIHTNASDGCWSPNELVDEIVKSNIGLFSVTDHDSIGNVIETSKLAKDRGLYFLNGVEISSTFNGKTCHILGYNIDPAEPLIIAICRENTDKMTNTNIEQGKVLASIGIIEDLDDFLNFDFNKRRGGSIIVRYLLDKKLFKTYMEALHFILKSAPESMPKFSSIEDAVRAIKKSGGTPILAHPGSSLLNKEAVDREEINKIIDMGIEGIECYTSYHDKESTSVYLEICKEHNLNITAGSDCHGPIIPERRLGQPAVEVEDLKLDKIFPTRG